jgi:hypothetical protein
MPRACYHPAMLDTRQGRHMPGMGNRLTVGLQTLTLPV